MRYNAYPYQDFASEHVIKNSGCGLFLEMGLGKTVSTLTAVETLMYDCFQVSKVLVTAPLRPARDVWPAEIQKWDHLRHFRVSKILGPKKDRIAALRAKADIYIINHDNLAWLVSYLGSGFDFDMLIIDELSCFKDPRTQRFKALRLVRPNADRVVGLTGTPATEGLVNLWSQLYLLDRGERLGKSVTAYRSNYFRPGRRNGNIVFEYELLPGSEEEIYKKIGDICISMKTVDHLTLPERVDNFIPVVFDEKLQKAYDDFERTRVMELLEQEQITAANAAALSTKLLQFANGAVYDEKHAYHEVHALKIQALEEIIECANGQPVLVFYSYQHDHNRIFTDLRKYGPRKLEFENDIAEWNAGRIHLMLAHPRSAGHGLNLQAGGHIVVWFGLSWSCELYQQANARLHRQGQKEAVIIHHLIANKTIDEDVIAALRAKANGQDAFMGAVKARIEKYRK